MFESLTEKLGSALRNLLPNGNFALINTTNAYATLSQSGQARASLMKQGIGEPAANRQERAIPGTQS